MKSYNCSKFKTEMEQNHQPCVCIRIQARFGHEIIQMGISPISLVTYANSHILYFNFAFDFVRDTDWEC